ncbi:MAG TPA: hypothetical protein VF533_14330 [Solirubrobacteraceae bacterium]|jgi:hypothetical protein
MESYDVSDSGYPEEQPEGVGEDDTGSGTKTPDQEENAASDRQAGDAPSNDDGQNTGGG